MIYGNVELHNIEEVREIAGHGGVRLQRVPERVRQLINENAQARMLQPTNAEIRFTFSGDLAEVTLSSDASIDVAIMQGDFKAGHRVVGKDQKTIRVIRRERPTLLSEEQKRALPFSTDVFRLILGGANNQATYLHGVTGQNIAPPTKEQLPSLRMLAYGTSITQGYSATHADLGYASQAAWRLGADLINLGVAGCALCEAELADYIAARQDWDIAVLSISVNMIGRRFTIDDFLERVSYMVDTVASAHPHKPVFCVTIYPCFFDMDPRMANEPPPAPCEEYREALRSAVKAAGHPNLHLLEGPDILTDIRGLTEDLIHPSDNGMILMGENLARKIKQRLS